MGVVDADDRGHGCGECAVGGFGLDLDLGLNLYLDVACGFDAAVDLHSGLAHRHSDRERQIELLHALVVGLGLDLCAGAGADVPGRHDAAEDLDDRAGDPDVEEVGLPVVLFLLIFVAVVVVIAVVTALGLVAVAAFRLVAVAAAFRLSAVVTSFGLIGVVAVVVSFPGVVVLVGQVKVPAGLLRRNRQADVSLR